MIVEAHKDRPPAETVQEIQQILDALGIRVHEEHWTTTSERFHSVVIVDTDCPFLRTSGKGASRPLCRASGYAEFLERAQNGFLYHKRFGLMPGYDEFHPDVQVLDTRETLARYSDVLAGLYSIESSELEDLIGKSVSCTPFYRVAKKEVVDLPVGLIQACCGTNGACAGNTPAEAILQGVCEVMERFVRREILLRGMEAPAIRRSQLDDSGFSGLLEDLENQGFAVLVKDCTRGGQLPVLGVILINESRTRYRVTFGADPIFAVALHRALAEAVQGIHDKSELRWPDMPSAVPSQDAPEGAKGSLRKRDLVLELTKSHRFGGGKVPPEFVFSSRSSDLGRVKEAFQDRFTNHGDSLRWVRRLLKSAGHEILVRDVSFLGFPAYYVFIPGMSESLGPMDRMRLRFYYRDSDRLRKTLFRLASASVREVDTCIELIESYRQNPFLEAMLRHDERSIVEWLGLHTTATPSSYHRLSIHQWLAVMCHRVGNLAKASRYLGAFIDSATAPGEVGPYTRAVHTFFELRSAGWSMEMLDEHLAGIYGAATAAEVISDVADPRKAFQWLTLPECGDCTKCPVQANCHHESWKRRSKRLQDTMAEAAIEQKDLAAVFY